MGVDIYSFEHYKQNPSVSKCVFADRRVFVNQIIILLACLLACLLANKIIVTSKFPDDYFIKFFHFMYCKIQEICEIKTHALVFANVTLFNHITTI